MQKTQRLDFFLRKENLHQLPAKPPHKSEYRHAAEKSPQHTQYRALHRTEGIAAADFQRFTGDHSHQYLQKCHAHIGHLTPQAVAVHPHSELLRFGYKLHHGLAHEPADSSAEHHKYDDRHPADELFLVFRKMPFLHVRIILRVWDALTIPQTLYVYLNRL